MKTIPTETSHEPLPTGVDLLNVSIEVGGLPYVVEAEVPKMPDSFDLFVRVPEEEWTAAKPLVDAEVGQNPHFARMYRNEATFRLGEGRVGSVFIHSTEPADDARAIYISRIQSSNGYFPKGNKYLDAKGIGSATLDAVCTIADARGWRVYLEPLDRGGRLMQDELIEWYQRRGFAFEHDYRQAHSIPWPHGEGRDDGVRMMYSVHGSMMRLPQEPDPSSLIVNALQS